LDPKLLAEAVTVLKNMPRTGWLQRGVPPSEAETIAEHTFEVVSILTMISTVSGADAEKMLVMGIIHDWGESVTGDIPRSLTERLGREAKSRAEKEVVGELSVLSGFKQLREVFEEYEERGTREAIYVKLADLLATLRQARSYAARGFRVMDIADTCARELEALLAGVGEEGVRVLVSKLSEAEGAASRPNTAPADA